MADRTAKEAFDYICGQGKNYVKPYKCLYIYYK